MVGILESIVSGGDEEEEQAPAAGSILQSIVDEDQEPQPEDNGLSPFQRVIADMARKKDIEAVAAEPERLLLQDGREFDAIPLSFPRAGQESRPTGAGVPFTVGGAIDGILEDFNKSIDSIMTDTLEIPEKNSRRGFQTRQKFDGTRFSNETEEVFDPVLAASQDAGNILFGGIKKIAHLGLSVPKTLQLIGEFVDTAAVALEDRGAVGVAKDMKDAVAKITADDVENFIIDDPASFVELNVAVASGFHGLGQLFRKGSKLLPKPKGAPVVAEAKTVIVEPKSVFATGERRGSGVFNGHDPKAIDTPIGAGANAQGAVRTPVLKTVVGNTARRKVRTAPPTAAEMRVGAFAEQLEPQVADAVFTLNQKGIKTNSSGFAGEGSPAAGGAKLGIKNPQTIEFRLNADEIDRARKIAKRASPDAHIVQIGRDPGSVSLVVDASGKTLREVKTIFDKFASEMPALSGQPEVASVAATKFRATHQAAFAARQTELKNIAASNARVLDAEVKSANVNNEKIKIAEERELLAIGSEDGVEVAAANSRQSRRSMEALQDGEDVLNPARPLTDDENLILTSPSMRNIDLQQIPETAGLSTKVHRIIKNGKQGLGQALLPVKAELTNMGSALGGELTTRYENFYSSIQNTMNDRVGRAVKHIGAGKGNKASDNLEIMASRLAMAADQSGRPIINVVERPEGADMVSWDGWESARDNSIPLQEEVLDRLIESGRSKLAEAGTKGPGGKPTKVDAELMTRVEPLAREILRMNDEFDFAMKGSWRGGDVIENKKVIRKVLPWTGRKNYGHPLSRPGVPDAKIPEEAIRLGKLARADARAGLKKMREAGATHASVTDIDGGRLRLNLKDHEALHIKGAGMSLEAYIKSVAGKRTPEEISAIRAVGELKYEDMYSSMLRSAADDFQEVSAIGRDFHGARPLWGHRHMLHLDGITPLPGFEERVSQWAPSYISNMSRRIAYARSFGSLDDTWQLAKQDILDAGGSGRRAEQLKQIVVGGGARNTPAMETIGAAASAIAMGRKTMLLQPTTAAHIAWGAGLRNTARTAHRALIPFNRTDTEKIMLRVANLDRGIIDRHGGAAGFAPPSGTNKNLVRKISDITLLDVSVTDRYMRKWGVLAGHEEALGLIDIARTSKSPEARVFAREKLAHFFAQTDERGAFFNIEEIIGRGVMNDAETSFLANRFDELWNFRNTPANLPAWASESAVGVNARYLMGFTLQEGGTFMWGDVYRAYVRTKSIPAQAKKFKALGYNVTEDSLKAAARRAQVGNVVDSVKLGTVSWALGEAAANARAAYDMTDWVTVIDGALTSAEDFVDRGEISADAIMEGVPDTEDMYSERGVRPELLEPRRVMDSLLQTIGQNIVFDMFRFGFKNAMAMSSISIVGGAMMKVGKTAADMIADPEGSLEELEEALSPEEFSDVLETMRDFSRATGFTKKNSTPKGIPDELDLFEE